MIATAKPHTREDSVPDWHRPFLKMLSAIQRHARIAFRRLASLPPWSEADCLAKRATDDALKRELLREAVEWDDLNDRIAPMSDDTEG